VQAPDAHPKTNHHRQQQRMQRHLDPTYLPAIRQLLERVNEVVMAFIPADKALKRDWLCSIRSSEHAKPWSKKALVGDNFF